MKSSIDHLWFEYFLTNPGHSGANPRHSGANPGHSGAKKCEPKNFDSVAMMLYDVEIDFLSFLIYYAKQPRTWTFKRFSFNSAWPADDVKVPLLDCFTYYPILVSTI